MRKFVGLLVFLAAFVVCDSASLKDKCFDNKGLCPTMSNPCTLPLELIQEDISPCGCDYDCKPNFKCCENPCYPYRICLRAQSSDALETNENGAPLKPVDDNIKKIFKQVQDSISSDKDIKQPIIYQNNVASGHGADVATPEIKVNVYYNIIKNIIIRNMNVFKGGNKTVEDIGGVNNVKQTENNSGHIYIHNTNVVKVGDKTVEDIGEVNNVTQTESNSGIIIIQAGTHEDQGCLDDEDCKEGSGFHPSPTSKTPEGSGHVIDDVDLYHSGSGDDVNNFLKQLQVETPKLSKIPSKLRTADGTQMIFFDKEDMQEGKGGEILYDFDMIDI